AAGRRAGIYRSLTCILQACPEIQRIRRRILNNNRRRREYKMKQGSMKLGFIGTGNMAGAIMGGIIKNEIFRPEEIIGADISPAGRERVKETYGIHVTADNREAAEKAEVLILSVKPQYYAEAIAEIRDCVSDDQLIITIAPGKTLAWPEEQDRKSTRLNSSHVSISYAVFC